jgi:membrane protein DedA with SNARE-associated domain
MSFETLAHLIEVYRYWVLVPLAFIEGPIVSFVAGTLASVGYINPYIALAILGARDIIVDTGCWLLGRYAKNLRITQRILAHFSVSNEAIDSVRNLWNEHGFRTMFISKLSYGISAAFLVVAGMVDIPFRRFFKYGIAITIFQYGILFFLGYFFGAAFGSLYNIFNNILYAIAGFSLFAVIYYIARAYLRRRLLNEVRKKGKF